MEKKGKEGKGGKEVKSSKPFFSHSYSPHSPRMLAQQPQDPWLDVKGDRYVLLETRMLEFMGPVRHNTGPLIRHCGRSAVILGGHRNALEAKICSTD